MKLISISRKSRRQLHLHWHTSNFFFNKLVLQNQIPSFIIGILRVVNNKVINEIVTLNLNLRGRDILVNVDLETTNILLNNNNLLSNRPVQV